MYHYQNLAMIYAYIRVSTDKQSVENQTLAGLLENIMPPL